MSTIVSTPFWPAEIKPTILSPYAILRPRADELRELTKGLLIGEVATEFLGDWQFLHLDVIAPTMDAVRQRLLTVKHRAIAMYPAYVDSALAREAGPNPIATATDEELIEVIRRSLHYAPTKSILVSLIASANLKESASKGPAESGATPK